MKKYLVWMMLVAVGLVSVIPVKADMGDYYLLVKATSGNGPVIDPLLGQQVLYTFTPTNGVGKVVTMSGKWGQATRINLTKAGKGTVSPEGNVTAAYVGLKNTVKAHVNNPFSISMGPIVIQDIPLNVLAGNGGGNFGPVSGGGHH